jgi:hypothetical protein
MYRMQSFLPATVGIHYKKLTETYQVSLLLLILDVA